MTNIEIEYERNRITIDMRGHSGYAEHGSDIVCSALSTLEYIVVGYCDTYPGNAELAVYECGTGYSHIEIVPRSVAIYPVIDAVIIGFEALACKYPENVCIKN